MGSILAIHGEERIESMILSSHHHNWYIMIKTQNEFHPEIPLKIEEQWTSQVKTYMSK